MSRGVGWIRMHMSRFSKLQRKRLEESRIDDRISVHCKPIQRITFPSTKVLSRVAMGVLYRWNGRTKGQTSQLEGSSHQGIRGSTLNSTSPTYFLSFPRTSSEMYSRSSSAISTSVSNGTPCCFPVARRLFNSGRPNRSSWGMYIVSFRSEGQMIFGFTV